MQAISDFFMWLFTDKTGVIFLVIGGVLLCLVIAIVMERKTKPTNALGGGRSFLGRSVASRTEKGPRPKPGAFKFMVRAKGLEPS